jgi:hypothetical protein
MTNTKHPSWCQALNVSDDHTTHIRRVGSLPIGVDEDIDVCIVPAWSHMMLDETAS